MRGDDVEEKFKKRLQDDISRHFSYQSLMLSVLLIGLFVIFSLAPQQIGLYQDVNTIANRYQRFITKQEDLLEELEKNSLEPFLNDKLSSVDLCFHLIKSFYSQATPILGIFLPSLSISKKF